MPDLSSAGLPILWAVLGLIVAIPVSQILRGWAEGTIDPLMGIVMVISIMTLIALTWQTQGTIWMLLFVALLLAVCALGPFLTIYLDHRANRDNASRCDRQRALRLDALRRLQLFGAERKV